MTYDPADPEVSLRRSTPSGDLGPLWAQSPPEDQVQLGVGSLDEQYGRWRASPEGGKVFEAFCRLALGRVAAGATHLRAKALWEEVRDQTPAGTCNNSFASLVVREAMATYRTLEGVFELRQRTAR